jgi:hypothetical protein
MIEPQGMIPMSGEHLEQRSNLISQPSHRSGWSVVLVFACVALGFVASMAEYERINASTERNRAELLATSYSTVEGQLEDIGKFLADPHTRIISLKGSQGLSSTAAVIAWNTAQQNGYFLCDALPTLDSGTGYEIWTLHENDNPVKIATIDAKPGASVYPFRSWQSIPGKLRLEVTAGPRSAAKTPVFAGDIE